MNFAKIDNRKNAPPSSAYYPHPFNGQATMRFWPHERSRRNLPRQRSSCPAIWSPPPSYVRN